MPEGEDLCAVQAITLLPDYYDYYGARGPRGGAYNPAFVGEQGWMWRTEAEAADGTDIHLLESYTPRRLEKLIPAKLDVSVHFGDGPQTVGLCEIQPGVFDGSYTITVTMAIDGGGDLVATTIAATSGEKSENVAIDLAAQVVAGVTSVVDPDNANKVIFSADSGLLTKFELTYV